MSSKIRKDSRGRRLNKGEIERRDGYYMYRYTENGKRVTISARSLKELRAKEADLRRAELYPKAKITVLELVEKYIALKTHSVRHNTRVGYKFVLNLLRKQPFSQKLICDVRTSDAKQFLVELQCQGYGWSTITSVRGVLRPAFSMAVEDDVLQKNPWSFSLAGVVKNDSKSRIALTDEQVSLWLEFLRTDNVYSKYLDEAVLMLQTGMRVSEVAGLTLSDLDFDAKKIRVERQLFRDSTGVYHIEKTKSESGRRTIPMSDDVYDALQNIIAKRKKVRKEPTIDEVTSFLLLDKNGQPKTALHLENSIRWGLKKYHKVHPDKPLPHITPHVLRHTFCTNMAMAGMNIKSLQYLMGHAEAEITMNVYTHASYEHAEREMRRILGFENYAEKEVFVE